MSPELHKLVLLLSQDRHQQFFPVESYNRHANTIRIREVRRDRLPILRQLIEGALPQGTKYKLTTDEPAGFSPATITLK